MDAMSKDLEDRVTKMLSEWLNDNAPIGQERYRAPAKAVIVEVLNFLASNPPKKDSDQK